MRSSRIVCIIIIVALIFCSTSSVFANSNVYVTNQGTTYLIDSRDNINSGVNSHIGDLLSEVVHYTAMLVQRIGPRSEGDTLGVNGQLSNLRSMIYSIMQNVINYLGPVTTPSGSKSINELSYMIWSAITALGTSVDGTYTNSSLILAQEQAANTSLSSILSQDTTQTSHLANIRLSSERIYDSLKNVQWNNINITNNGMSLNNQYSIVSSLTGHVINCSFSFSKIAPSNKIRIYRLIIPYGSLYINDTDVNIYSNLSDDRFLIPSIKIYKSRYITELFFITEFSQNLTDLYVKFERSPSNTTIYYEGDDDSLNFSYVDSDSTYFYDIYNSIFLYDDLNYLEYLKNLQSSNSALSNIDTDLDNVISILDKSTSIVQNDNEVNINTNVSINDVNFVNTGVRRFKQFFDTGITAAAFGMALDYYAYDEFFDQEVTDLVQTVNSEYTEVPLVINTWPII